MPSAGAAGAAEPLCSTDIDGNGTAAPDTDAQLLLRHLFGFQGTKLTDGVVGEGCTRCTAEALAAHLETPACQVLFDVDGDGRRDALSDGILVWRYLAGYSGSTLAARSRFYPRVERWVQRWGLVTIFSLAALPSPLIDLAGIAAGTMRISFRRYLVACLAGKILRFTAVAWVGRMIGGWWG